MGGGPRGAAMKDMKDMEAFPEKPLREGYRGIAGNGSMSFRSSMPAHPGTPPAHARATDPRARRRSFPPDPIAPSRPAPGDAPSPCPAAKCLRSKIHWPKPLTAMEFRGSRAKRVPYLVTPAPGPAPAAQCTPATPGLRP